MLNWIISKTNERHSFGIFLIIGHRLSVFVILIFFVIFDLLFNVPGNKNVHNSKTIDLCITYSLSQSVHQLQIVFGVYDGYPVLARGIYLMWAMTAFF